MQKILFLSLLLLTNDLLGSDLPEVRTVPSVNVSRYMGEWYEIARYPARFQEGCLASSATYNLRPDGEIDVINRCRDEEDGRLREAKGKAWVVDSTSNAKLKGSFFWPFRGDYWIIDLGKEYEYAVVATPDRKYLWILGRKPALGKDVLDGILQRLKEQRFDPEKLIWRRD
ncbi:lipocalin family protein [Geobacter sp. DSM 9736]|uniref:lipocalin family protein n=1 Tax=Geobacter sp. DSM 9736 TaxID=1277350 RepID=UPI000B50EFD8|nr:lipocalin family protein [Geobacter sp. DSM 9736]SNB45321.1 apolipoprotein D and lipocalin family protein [Geobacter sp. DSM 9736]